MTSRFTEHDTEQFYDAEDALYRSFWDKAGSLHWGIFDNSTGDDFLKACANLGDIMVGMASITPDSRILDLGCGNGNTAIWLSNTTGCEVVGIDLSGVRVENARLDLAGQPAETRDRVRFEKASATALPFEDAYFSHVWSQATIYHVHDKRAALSEAYRVLGDGGVFVFDDLIKPKAEVSEQSRKYVYARLLFDTEFSFGSYQAALGDTGFKVLDARDVSPHLQTSYQHLAAITADKSQQDADRYKPLSFAYQQMVRAVEEGELGWGLYLCRK